MNFQELNSIYFLGIGGAGVSGLARMAARHGKTVQGSDASESAITRALSAEGIMVHTTQSADHIPLDYDLYVYSDAVTEDNPERRMLKQHHLDSKEMSYFQALGEFMKAYHHRIAVSGTHGKTTTTAMLSLVLEAAQLDPTAIVGSTVKAWNSNVRVGQDREYFVVEACEYREHMCLLHPTAIILTNIEEDHLDYYRDIDHISMAFQKYINALPSDGVLIRNADDSESRDIGFDGATVSYGIVEPADVMATQIEKSGQHQTFTINGHTYTINVPGDFNIYNALAVIAYALYIDIAPDTIQRGLTKFSGTWRRFEHVGSYKNAVVISDYAHHPTAVNGIIKATREWYPKRRVVMVYQPHQHNRTKHLFAGFVESLAQADLIIVQEIFDVAGREAIEDQSVSSRDLATEIEQHGKLALYSPNKEKTKQLLAEHVEADDVVLVVGAGDIYTVAEDICSKD